MRAFAGIGMCLVIALAAVALRPAGAANSDAANEMALLLGTWDCEDSAAGVFSRDVYRRRDATTMDVARAVRAPGGASGAIDERFHFDRASGFWSVDAGKNRFYEAEHLAAPAWAGDRWLFTGTQTSGGRTQSVRVLFAYDPPDTFVRDYESATASRSAADGTFLCRRAALATRYDEGEPPPDEIAAVAPPRLAPSVPLPAPSVPPFRVALGAVARRPAPVGGGVDRAYSLTRGIWDCTTFGGALATHTYTREPGGIKLHNVLRIASRDYAIDETYRFDAAKRTWTTDTLAEAYVGVAGRWLADRWVFNGDMPLGSRRVPAQMIYTSLGEGVFRRDFIRTGNGERQTFAAETCRRR